MHGEFHFESTPTAPPGTKALTHIKPNKRASWGFHADYAWYIGPVMDHYWCYKVLMHKKNPQQITGTVRFQHHAVQIPQILSAERIEKATKALTNAVKNVPVEAPPDYVMAVQQLWVVLLNERAQAQKQHLSQPQPMKEAPQHTKPSHD
eukprot:1733528-Ditylum_brightwellii.AAC.1